MTQKYTDTSQMAQTLAFYRLTGLVRKIVDLFSSTQMQIHRIWKVENIHRVQTPTETLETGYNSPWTLW